jgi:hypothetical protein
MLLPSLDDSPDVGDGKYDIYAFAATGELTLLAHDRLGGSEFDFGALGIDAFRVTGIEGSAGLDPSWTRLR